jgi:class 3 adenylate cyclase/tetratricopeptide (TPR) repeat protein
MADEVGRWLQKIGLGKYADVFAANEITFEALRHLSEDDLKELGLPMGPRKLISAAIADLADPATPKKAAPPDDPPDRRADAERRQLTVMFCDLVGSTALSARLDPEEMREVLRAYQEAVVAAVGRFDGHVAKYLGDGVLVYFGWPRAHEDDAERAIRAGLDAVKAVGALELARDVRLQARVGIATGLVVAGDLVGSGVTEASAVAGETPNLAARLQGLAEPGAVVIGGATHRSAGALFECAALGSQSLKGFEAPILVWTVVRPRRAESRFDSLRAAHLTDLVGREEEIDTLLRRWQRAKRGEGQIVLISGEPGIGKSRLAHALKERLAGEPHTPVTLQCSPFHSNSPLHPMIDQLERAAGFEAADSTGAKLDKLEALLLQSGPLAEDAALIASLLSLPADGRYPPLAVSAQRQKELTLDTLAKRLVVLSEQQPVVLLVEDAHWIDPTTLELMGLLVDRIPDASVLAIVTYRPEFAAPWVGRPRVTPIILGRLERQDCALLVEKVVLGRVLPQQVRDQIVAQTDGVPLFVEETTKSVLESAHGSGKRIDEISIPATLRGSLEARLDRLGPAKEIAQIGSVIGREFDYELLARVTPATGLDLDMALSRLVASELVYCRGQPPEARYTFKHALVQDTAYASLVRGRRRELHGRVADAIVTHFPDRAATEPGVLARHCAEAGRIKESIAYTLRASEATIVRANHDEGVAVLEAGLETLEAMPQGAERATLELDLQVALSWAIRLGKGPAVPRNEIVLQRALELCRDVGGPPHLSQILFGLALMHIWRGQLAQAIGEAEQLMTIAEKNGDRSQLIMGLSVLAQSLFHVGRNTEARGYYGRLDALYDPAIDLRQRYAWGVFHVRAHAAELRFVLGEPDQALAYAEAMLSLARASQDKVVIHLGLFHLAAVCTWRGDIDRLSELADETLSISGNMVTAVAGAIQKAWCAAVRGNVGGGAEAIAQSLEVWRGLGFKLWTPAYACLFAEVLLMDGRPHEALRVADENLDLIAETGERQFESLVLGAKGDALLALGPSNAADAEACYRSALDLARSQSAKSWELRAAIRLARLWHSRGRTNAARDLLAPIYGRFTEGFDTADLKEAKALLDELR